MKRRPRLTLHGASPTREEAAAVVAAIEQFLRDTARPPTPPPDRPGGWTRAARLEGVGREPDAPSPWGDLHRW